MIYEIHDPTHIAHPQTLEKSNNIKTPKGYEEKKIESNTFQINVGNNDYYKRK